MTEKEWKDKGRSLFGDDMMQWRFTCPVCGHVAAAKDWRDAGAPAGAIAFSCVGRYLPEASDAFSGRPGPCNYAGGGLFKLNPVEVDGARYFEFATPS